MAVRSNSNLTWRSSGRTTARLLFRLRRFESALAAFDAGLEVASARDADLLNGRAASLRELGRLEESAATASEALRREPRSAEAALNLGNALHKLGRPAEALAAYRRALALKPDYADALCGSGSRCARSAGSTRRARLSCEAEALGCREAIAGRGCLDLMLGDFEPGFEGYEARWIAGRSLAEALGPALSLVARARGRRRSACSCSTITGSATRSSSVAICR